MLWFIEFLKRRGWEYQGIYAAKEYHFIKDGRQLYITEYQYYLEMKNKNVVRIIP